jgi:hypothetical protein
MRVVPKKVREVIARLSTGVYYKNPCEVIDTIYNILASIGLELSRPAHYGSQKEVNYSETLGIYKRDSNEKIGVVAFMYYRMPLSGNYEVVCYVP